MVCIAMGMLAGTALGIFAAVADPQFNFSSWNQVIAEYVYSLKNLVGWDSI